MIFEQEEAAYGDISDQTISNLLVKLQQTTQHLIEHVKEKQWSEALLADALTRSRSEGFLWCVVLGGVLKDLHRLGLPYEPTVLLAEVQFLASIEEKECQTFNTLISHVNGIYELKVITEQYTRLLREENDEGGKCRRAQYRSSLKKIRTFSRREVMRTGKSSATECGLTEKNNCLVIVSKM